MATHEVKLSLNQRITVEKVDATFPVWSDGERLGRLRVSKGSVDWQPARSQMVYRVTWEDFAELMQENGRRRTVRKRARSGRQA